MTYIEAVRELDELAAMIDSTRDAEAIRVVLGRAAWMRSRLYKLAVGDHDFPPATVAKAALSEAVTGWRPNHENIEKAVSTVFIAGQES